MSATIGMIPAGLTAFSFLVALLAWPSAPAVSVSVVAGLIGGAIAFVIEGADGPHGVPLAVGMGFSLGIVVGAIVGIAVTRRRARGTWPMRRTAVWFLAATPFLVITLLLTALDACPLYDERRRAGYCYNAVDVLGDWVSGVTVLFAFDLLVLVALLWIAPGRRETPVGDRRSRRIQTVGAVAIGSIAVAWWLFPSTPEVVGMSPQRAYVVLRTAGFDAEYPPFEVSTDVAGSRCAALRRGAGEPASRDPVMCVVRQQPRIGLLGHAARGTAITLYVERPEQR